MRVNLEWLRDWVDVGTDGGRIADELTTVGLEVDEVTPAGPVLDGVVIARVVECGPHPNADRLSLCTVDDGQTRHQVVCGAPNVAAGVSAPFARPGATLPGGVEIRAAEVRGVASNGMLCSAKELGLEADSSGLLLLDRDAPAGTPLGEYLKLDDTVLDIAVTPNRGDCFSVLGIARELAAKRGLPLASTQLRAVPPKSDARFSVTLEAADDCPRFAGRVIRNVPQGGRSPLWLRERLRRAGLRPISPIVDVTNYVMLELGQPLHAYDLAKLDRCIVVRRAHAGEQLELLDGETRELDDSVLVIADATSAVGMAGIMGGGGTAVDDSTTDIFLESAFFTPAVMAGRARRFGLHTDASMRFERGVDPEGQVRAVERATELLLQIAGGVPGPTVLTEAGEGRAPRRIPLRRARVSAVLGMDVADDEIESLLTRLGIGLERVEGGWTAAAPSYRFDLAIEEDLIEEIGRLVGYDQVPSKPGTATMRLGSASELTVSEDRFADTLVARGYHEVVTFGFVDPALDRLIEPDAEPIELANPLSSDLAVMRSSLWPGLVQVARQNLARQQPRLKLFEIGRCFRRGSGEGFVETTTLAGVAAGARTPEHWSGVGDDIDFYDVKADLAALWGLTGSGETFSVAPAPHAALHPGRSASILRSGQSVGWVGELHPRLQRELGLRRPLLLFTLNLDAAAAATVPAYHRTTRFPTVRRDLALVVEEGVHASALLDEAKAGAGESLERAIIFDVYKGPGIEAGRKSVALGLILQGVSRTLTDADADQVVAAVVQRLERNLGARTRT